MPTRLFSKRFHLIAVVAAGVVVIALASYAMWPALPALLVRNGEGRAVFIAPVRPGGHFTIRFIHSVAKTPVEEIFEVERGGGFRLRETVYADFGAGLPHEEGPGQRMEFANGRIRLTGFDREFRELTLRVGRTAEHTLLLEGGEEVRLADFIPPGGEARLAVQANYFGRYRELAGLRGERRHE